MKTDIHSPNPPSHQTPPSTSNPSNSRQPQPHTSPRQHPTAASPHPKTRYPSSEPQTPPSLHPPSQPRHAIIPLKWYTQSNYGCLLSCMSVGIWQAEHDMEMCACPRRQASGPVELLTLIWSHPGIGWDIFCLFKQEVAPGTHSLFGILHGLKPSTHLVTFHGPIPGQNM